MTSPRPKVRLRAARAAMKRLQADPEESAAVLEIVQAMAGRQPERLLARVRRHPEGRRLLRERPDFAPTEADLEALAQLPEQTFGREFAIWMQSQRFDPGPHDRAWPGEGDVAYLGQRMVDVHDLWHVLSGYNRDPVGELGFISFIVGQTWTPGFAFILAHVLARSVWNQLTAERTMRNPLVAYLWRAYRAGARARFLVPLVLEELLDDPLDQVRARLGVEPLPAAINEQALPPIAAPAAQRV